MQANGNGFDAISRVNEIRTVISWLSGVPSVFAYNADFASLD